jgi:hypothetical protein
MFFDPGRIHVRFAVEEVALGQVILRIFRASSFSTISSMLYTYAFYNYRNKRENLGTIKTAVIFLTSDSFKQKVL